MTADPVATPKTDAATVYAQEDSIYTPALYESDLEFVPADFARAQERRIAELELAIRMFAGSAVSVSTEIDQKGWAWCEPYFQQALDNAKSLYPEWNLP